MKSSFSSNHIKSLGRLNIIQHYTQAKFISISQDKRNPFERDRDSIIHSSAFRKLEYKTQVFPNNVGDYYRTRLTHTLEVAQVARSLARKLMIDEDLTESIALAHDIGHPPFGHAGENALSNNMKHHGGFDHNAQSLRIVTTLEKRYASFDGLNLSWEVLEGIAKHNGPTDNPNGYLESYSKSYQNLNINMQPGLESQIASLADDIAYNAHDIEDGLKAELFSLQDLHDGIPLVHDMMDEIESIHGKLPDTRVMYETKRRLITFMINDVYNSTISNLKKYYIQTLQDIQQCPDPISVFSEEALIHNKNIRDFLNERLYKHYKVNRMMSQARKIVGSLFNFFYEEPECLPDEWPEIAKESKARAVCDFIAGMTDRFATNEYDRIFNIG